MPIARVAHMQAHPRRRGALDDDAPCGVYFAALLSRLDAPGSSRTASPSTQTGSPGSSIGHGAPISGRRSRRERATRRSTGACSIADHAARDARDVDQVVHDAAGRDLALDRLANVSCAGSLAGALAITCTAVRIRRERVAQLVRERGDELVHVLRHLPRGRAGGGGR